MKTKMDILNTILNPIFEFIFLPFENVNPFWAMLTISSVTGVFMLIIFKATSDQKGIKKAKNLVKGHFLAIRLYRDDFSVMIDTMKNIIKSNLLYMKKSLRPMLFLLIPVGLVLFQIGTRYEFRPLRVGESTIVTLKMMETSAFDDLAGVELALPQGIAFEMPPVRIPQNGEVSWRIRVEKPGVHELIFRCNGQTLTKQLHAVDALVPVAAEIASDDIVVTLMNPGEESLGSAGFASFVGVEYPRRPFQVAGFEMHWLIAFFVISLVAAFSLKGLLGVEV
jgi:uncharacterized membrane protein (DUF106 family)